MSTEKMDGRTGQKPSPSSPYICALGSPNENSNGWKEKHAIGYQHGAGIESLMPKLHHSDYHTEPSIKERAEPGFFHHVKDFTIGRHGYGSIRFFAETDVRRLELVSNVQFNDREVIVYGDESKKPGIGQGPNKPAEEQGAEFVSFDPVKGEWTFRADHFSSYEFGDGEGYVCFL